SHSPLLLPPLLGSAAAMLGNPIPMVRYPTAIAPEATSVARRVVARLKFFMRRPVARVVAVTPVPGGRRVATWLDTEHTASAQCLDRSSPRLERSECRLPLRWAHTRHRYLSAGGDDSESSYGTSGSNSSGSNSPDAWRVSSAPLSAARSGPGPAPGCRRFRNHSWPSRKRPTRATTMTMIATIVLSVSTAAASSTIPTTATARTTVNISYEYPHGLQMTRDLCPSQYRSRSSRLYSLPFGSRGNSSTKSMLRGHLYVANSL